MYSEIRAYIFYIYFLNNYYIFFLYLLIYINTYYMWLALGDTKVIPQRYLGEALGELVLFVGSLLVFFADDFGAVHQVLCRFG